MEAELAVTVREVLDLPSEAMEPGAVSRSVHA
jgi:hypothetical protein